MKPRMTTLAFALVQVLTASAIAQAPPPQPQEEGGYPWEGEVTGQNVYVRSGPGSNWYPTVKLNTGNRVLVLDEKFGWYRITPPKGSFSYVDQAVVDRAPGASAGTVKEDKVFVRAGSELENRKTATQLVLNKGAKVEIIGEAEGFYKINPPAGAALYISKTYVTRVPLRLRTGLTEKQQVDKKADSPLSTPEPAKEQQPLPRSAGTPIPADEPPIPGTEQQPFETTETTTAPAGAAEPEGEPLDLDAPMDTAGAEPPADLTANRPSRTTGDAAPPLDARPRYEVLLNQLEKLLQAELRRPTDQQDLAGLRARYEEIAKQTEDRTPGEIAKIRVAQLRDWEDLVSARGAHRVSADQLAGFRAELEAERKRIMDRKLEPPPYIKYDFEGELRRSYAFASQQRRFRLINPENGTTVAYVDVPPNVDANPEFLVGRIVGIKASGRQFSPSARVPIAVAAKIADLGPGGQPGLPTTNPAESSNSANTAPSDNKSTTEARAASKAVDTRTNRPVAATGEPQP